MTYIVDATVRQQGDSIVRHVGKFETDEAAIAAARGVVDEILREHHRAGMKPRELFAAYEKTGVFPYVFLDHDEQTFNVRSFNHYQYALQRCTALCGSNAGNDRAA